MTPTHAPGIITAPTWKGEGTVHITGHIIIADGDRILVDRDSIRELLIEADDQLTLLAIDLMHKWDKMTGDNCGWDPDAYYTPLENRLHRLAEAFGYDYNRDIAAEAYRRRRLARAKQGADP